MTRLTRNAATEVFVTVMTNILGVETNSPLSLALVQIGVQDILDLIGLNFAEIESLTYRPAPTDDNTTPVAIAVPIGQRNRVQLFKAWIGSIASLSGQMSLTTDQWNELTQEDFDSFRTLPALLGTTQLLKLLPLVVPQEKERTPTVSMTSERGFAATVVSILSSRTTSISTTRKTKMYEFLLETCHIDFPDREGSRSETRLHRS